jgi:hypothetical protein
MPVLPQHAVAAATSELQPRTAREPVRKSGSTGARAISVVTFIATGVLCFFLQGCPDKETQKQKRWQDAQKASDPQEQIKLYTQVIEDDPKDALGAVSK